MMLLGYLNNALLIIYINTTKAQSNSSLAQKGRNLSKVIEIRIDFIAGKLFIFRSFLSSKD